MHRRVLVGIAVAIALLGGVGIAVLDSPTQSGLPSDQQSTQQPLELAQIEQANETQFRITVLENGDARWTVEYRQRITDEQEIEDFRQYAERFNTEETETFSNFQQRADRLTQDGTEVTDREMNATDFQREARYSEISRDGIVEMSFRWVGFAQQNGEQVIVSDVFDGGFVILEDQRLRIERGENVSFDSVSPSPDEVDLGDESDPGEWVEWNGYREFSPGEIDVRLSPPDVTPTDPTNGTGSDDGTDTGSEDPEIGGGGSGMMVPLMLGLLVLLGVGGSAIWYTMARTDQDASSGSAEPSPQVDEQAETGGALETEQLLSDEDRVLKLLEDNGGRMRQVTIVEETEWSKSKVSMLLSDMEDEGEISKLRVGRENIISLAGEEPEAAGSPFEDENR
ncbi:helix-turn-helix transcriptional regulator [Halovenus sp. HT40]|uniref:helix-turn-helix transcriptional regulator n=1 Tax=Halovenus sp. HT40 TaxID=3126691 RepID=UPI00300EEC91